MRAVRRQRWKPPVWSTTTGCAAGGRGPVIASAGSLPSSSLISWRRTTEPSECVGRGDLFCARCVCNVCVVFVGCCGAGRDRGGVRTYGSAYLEIAFLGRSGICTPTPPLLVMSGHGARCHPAGGELERRSTRVGSSVTVHSLFISSLSLAFSCDWARMLCSP